MNTRLEALQAQIEQNIIDFSNARNLTDTAVDLANQTEQVHQCNITIVTLKMIMLSVYYRLLCWLKESLLH